MRREVIKVLSLLIAVSLLGGGVGACKLLCDPPSLRITGDSRSGFISAFICVPNCFGVKSVGWTCNLVHRLHDSIGKITLIEIHVVATLDNLKRGVTTELL